MVATKVVFSSFSWFYDSFFQFVLSFKAFNVFIGFDDGVLGFYGDF